MLHVIVPYRNREAHLSQFVPAMRRYLGRDEFCITVVEQANEKRFNRALLLNAGFLNNPAGTTCVALHDVDHIPLYVDYSEPEIPTDLLGGQYYDGHLGGVTLFPVEQYERVNGMSNQFWGWGGEDDDLAWRVKTILGAIGERACRFVHLAHESGFEAVPHSSNLKRLYARTDPMTDGLKQCEFEIVARIHEDGYERLQITF